MVGCGASKRQLLCSGGRALPRYEELLVQLCSCCGKHWPSSRHECVAGKDGMTSISVFLLLGLRLVHGQATDDRIECYKDEDGPADDPNNIYRCSKTEMCCNESGLPSCCREKPTSVAAWEQAQLWGTLAAMIIVLALLMWYCRHDGDCCGNKKDQRRKGCCCCGSSSRDPDDSDIEITTGPEGKNPAVYADLKEEGE